MSFLTNLLGGLSGALSTIPGLGPAGQFISTFGSSLFGSMAANEQWDKEARFNAHQAQLNRNFQKQERISSQLFNMEMWDRNNEYNSPVQQLKRAQQAGINPNSVINGMSPASSSPVSTSPMSGSMASAPGSLASSLLVQDATLANLFANTRKTNAEANNETYELTWNKMTEAQRYDALITMNHKAKADIQKLLSDVGMNDFSKDIQERQFRWFASKSEEEINVMKQQANLLYNQNAEVLAKINLTNEQAETEKSKQNLLDEQAFNTYLDSKQTVQETKYMDAQTVGQEIDNDLKSIELEFCSSQGIPLNTPDSQLAFRLFCSGRYEEYLTLMGQQGLENAIQQGIMGFTLGNHNLEIANKHYKDGIYPGPRRIPNYVGSYNKRHGYINP